MAQARSQANSSTCCIVTKKMEGKWTFGPLPVTVARRRTHPRGLLRALATALKLRAMEYCRDTMCGLTAGPTASFSMYLHRVHVPPLAFVIGTSNPAHVPPLASVIGPNKWPNVPHLALASTPVIGPMYSTTMYSTYMYSTHMYSTSMYSTNMYSTCFCHRHK